LEEEAEEGIEEEEKVGEGAWEEEGARRGPG
jgi:hypothetical protein